jgi:6,7-dimethyl-8-ribityllumazine synthase
MHEMNGSLEGAGLRIALVVSRFNGDISAGLERGARAELSALGVPDEGLTLVHVPGALERARAAEWLARAGQQDALIVLGAVIRGDTDHYDFVCSEATRGCGRVALTHGLPVLFGVLTCDSLAQAAARSGHDGENKGTECATAAVQMARLARQIRATGDSAS